MRPSVGFALLGVSFGGSALALTYAELAHKWPESFAIGAGCVALRWAMPITREWYLARIPAERGPAVWSALAFGIALGIFFWPYTLLDSLAIIADSDNDENEDG